METAVMVFCIVIVFTAGFFIMRRVDRMMDRERNTEKYGSTVQGRMRKQKRNRKKQKQQSEKEERDTWKNL